MAKKPTSSLASRARRKRDLISELRSLPAPTFDPGSRIAARKQWLTAELALLEDVPFLSRAELARISPSATSTRSPHSAPQVVEMGKVGA